MSEGGDRGSGAGRLGTVGLTGGDLVEKLRSTLDRAGELVRVLEENLGAMAGTAAASGETGDADPRVTLLEKRLRSAENDVKELATRLVDSEHQAGRLMNLYVATYQLHSTLDPDEVQQTISEIAINLLGAKSFVLLLARDGEAAGCDVALAVGTAEDGRWLDVYQGGDPTIDATLRDGLLRLGSEGAEELVAAVPLRVQDKVVGALVVLRLLDHKPILRPEDRDLLDLLSAHAASAIFAARLYAAKERKVKSLQSLVDLARGETT
ncbi:MAG TPA: GAF domain-containing protein [Thermoanaerobaculia bacterium]|nr:GAF domain-containing protein [Thermoanaerobaculia bacterium]